MGKEEYKGFPVMTNSENIIEDLRKMAAVCEEDFEDSFTDDYRVVYSKDGKRLLSGRDLRKCWYELREGTEVICNDAFKGCSSVKIVVFPKSLKYIGDRAFQSTFIDFCVVIKGLKNVNVFPAPHYSPST